MARRARSDSVVFTGLPVDEVTKLRNSKPRNTQPPGVLPLGVMAKRDAEDDGAFRPASSSAESGWEPPAEVNFEGASSRRLKRIDSAAEMRRIAGVKSQERYSQQLEDVDDALDRESLNQSWSQWFMYGTSAPVGLIRHSVMSSIYDMEAVRKLVFPRSYCNLASKGESHFRRSMSVLDAEYPVLNASGSGVDVTIGYRLYPFRRCADRCPPPHPPPPSPVWPPPLHLLHLHCLRLLASSHLPRPWCAASGKVPRAP